MNNKNSYVLKITVRELKCMKIFHSPSFASETLSARRYKDKVSSTHTNNPHIVRFHDSFIDDQGRLSIVMEYVPKSLLSIIEKYNLGLRPLKRVKAIIAQVLFGLYSMHQLGIIHRDIKPENILINENPQEENEYQSLFKGIGFVKLCDFGSVGFVEDYTVNSNIMTPYIATRWYRAPELIVGVKGGVYNDRVDIWACGCLLAELLDGQPLFPGESDIDQLYKIQSLVGPITDEQQKMFSQNAGLRAKGDPQSYQQGRNLDKIFQRKIGDVGMDFLKGCLSIDPSQRFSSIECLRHQWLDDVVSEFGWIIDFKDGGIIIPSLSLHDLPESVETHVFVPSESFLNDTPVDLSPVNSESAKKMEQNAFIDTSPIELSVKTKKSLEEKQSVLLNDINDDSDDEISLKQVIIPKSQAKEENHVFNINYSLDNDVSSWNVFGEKESQILIQQHSPLKKNKKENESIIVLETENSKLKNENNKLKQDFEKLKEEFEALRLELEAARKAKSESKSTCIMM